MKLLIAEDDLFFERLLLQILGPNYDITVAHDGNEAWEKLNAPDAPKLAILDWVMPGLSGPQVCRKVRACGALSSMYLIILTAKNNEADIVSGLRAGADDYITKPPIPAELLARVSVGERILALQDAVKAQSLLTNQGLRDEAPERSRGKYKPTSQEHFLGIAPSLRQQCDPQDRASSGGEADCLLPRVSGDSVEKYHPLR
jgi:DNA-binding response OmpR family regulator